MRLTQTHRLQIVKDVLTYKFKQRLIDEYQERADLFVEIYKKIYTPSERGRMTKLPKGWLMEDCRINLSIAENKKDAPTTTVYLHTFGEMSQYRSHCPLYLKDGFGDLPPAQQNMLIELVNTAPDKTNQVPPVYRFPYSARNGYVTPVTPSSEAAQLAFKYRDLYQDTCQEIYDDFVNLFGILRGFTTRAKLIDAWPEIEDFVPPEPPANTLPMLITQQLNAEFGLPPS